MPGDMAGRGGGAAARRARAAASSGSRRTLSQLAMPVATAAETPISRMATTAACQPDGPTAASRPLPSGPPENAASTPITHPVATPQANPHSGATSAAGVGAARATRMPPTTPAR